MKNKSIKSPLVKNVEAILDQTIIVEDLIRSYKNKLNIDVSSYFNNLKEIYIYQCIETKYRFYYPFDIDGDSRFYEQLQDNDWYYMPWKWEHEIALQNLIGNEKILEVGSGGLGFLEKMQELGYDTRGLELNKDSVEKGKRLNLKVEEETIQTHAQRNKEKYDVVCSFQVLEHVTDVHSFIKSQIDCLKTGGKLIISVPNNDSFIKLDNNLILNQPPHHMGLWNKDSLMGLTTIFDIKTDKVLYEPLAKYHLDWYIKLNIQERFNKYKFSRILFKKLKLKKRFTNLISKFSPKIHGHSMMVIYTKV